MEKTMKKYLKVTVDSEANLNMSYAEKAGIKVTKKDGDVERYLEAKAEKVEMVKFHLKVLAEKMGGYDEEDYLWRNPAALLLDRGVSMGGHAVNTKLAQTIAESGHHRQKHCYLNASMLMQHADWDYCEGYVTQSGWTFPIAHAWLEMDGSVYDPTLNRYDLQVFERVILNNTVNCYFGVKLSKEMVLTELLKRGKSFSVLQDYENGYPVLKEGSKWLM